MVLGQVECACVHRNRLGLSGLQTCTVCQGWCNLFSSPERVCHRKPGQVCHGSDDVCRCYVTFHVYFVTHGQFNLFSHMSGPRTVHRNVLSSVLVWSPTRSWLRRRVGVDDGESMRMIRRRAMMRTMNQLMKMMTTTMTGC